MKDKAQALRSRRHLRASLFLSIAMLVAGCEIRLTQPTTCCPTWQGPPPAPPPPPTPAAAPVAQRKIVLRGVHFDFDKSAIRPDAVPVLDEAVRILQENPDLEVVIEGHTDGVGSVEYNQALGMRRARAVRDYLVDRGIAAARLRTVSYGETRPVASNETADGRAQNRRVELRVVED